MSSTEPDDEWTKTSTVHPLLLGISCIVCGKRVNAFGWRRMCYACIERAWLSSKEK